VFRKIVAVAIMAVGVAPGFAVESMYLDTAPVTYPGEYLAPADFYFQVPPPGVSLRTALSLAPSTVYDFGILNPPTAAATASSVTYLNVGSDADDEMEDEEAHDRSERLRVLLKPGLDHASDVPLAVMRERLALADDIELVDENSVYDVMVEVETMRLAGAGTVFVVVNAYKFVGDESLIFYNNFGYLGELKLLSGSESYADKLESALLDEAAEAADY